MDCGPPGSSSHGISQTRILEWVAISFLSGASSPGFEPASPGLQPARFLCPWHFPDKNIGVGCHFPLQEIFPIQGLKLCLLLVGQFFTTETLGLTLLLTRSFIDKSCILHIFFVVWTENHMCAKSLQYILLFSTLWTVVHQ